MRCRTSLSHAKGSTLLSFAVAMREQTVAHRTPPPSEPANRWFLRPSVTAAARASTFVALVLGDAHLEMTPGYEVPDFKVRFKKQIEEAIQASLR
jgi:hypothetical protein